MRFLVTIAALSMSACGYKEADFTDDYTHALCDKIFECTDEATLAYLPYSTADECYTYSTDSTDTASSSDNCDYSSADAKTCVDETTAMTCDDYSTGNFPASCSAVCG